jgi:spore maturation protein CgeB
MRFLILDHYYPEFIAATYRASPGLQRRSFAEQQAALDAGLFGESQFQAAALRGLGHEALHLPVNVQPLLAALAQERDIPLRRGAVQFRLRRGIVPWLVLGGRTRSAESLLPGIADRLGADVVHVQCMDVLDPAVVADMQRPGRRITGQTAAPKPVREGLGPYDLVFSSLPNYVDHFRREGVRAELLPLAFAPEVSERVEVRDDRDVAVSFVGSISSAHRRRSELLNALVADGVSLDLWSTGIVEGAQRHPPVWGRDMYAVLGRSQMTLNSHGEHAAGHANNLRLFEATGMGALLLTEEASNLESLFAPGAEVVTYRDARSLARAIAHFVAHPDEARSIAEAGRRRTLRDHTWPIRTGQMLELMG